MTIQKWTVTGNTHDQLGDTVDPTRVRIRVEVNLPEGVYVDRAADDVLLGRKVVKPAADGSYAIAGLLDHDDSDGVQYRFTFEYVDDTALLSRTGPAWQTAALGWFSITADTTIGNLVDEQYIPAEQQSTIRAELQALVDQATELTGIDSTDSAQAYNIDNGPLTKARLTASIATATTGWAPGRKYKAGDVIQNPFGWEIVAQADHTASAAYATDVQTDKWRLTHVPAGYDGNTVAAAGDSITANNGASNAGNVAEGYAAHAGFASGQRLRFSGPTVAVGGYTVQQLRDTLLPNLLAMTNPKPNACFVLIGTNNVGGGSYNYITDRAALKTVYDRMLAMSIKPIACTIPPRTDNTDLKGWVDQWNGGVRKLAGDYGLDVVDFHSLLTNQTSSSYKTGLNRITSSAPDIIHPSFAGLKAMGVYAAALLAERFPNRVPYLARHAGDATDLLSGVGLFLTDVSADGCADGVSPIGNGTGRTFSRVGDDDGETIWQRLTVTSAAAAGGLLGQIIVTLPATGTGIADWKTLQPGDVFEIAGRIQTSGFDERTTPDGTLAYSVGITFNGSSTVVGAITSMHTDIADGVFLARGTVPSDANGTIKVSMSIDNGPPASGAVWMQVSRLIVRNLTAAI